MPQAEKANKSTRHLTEGQKKAFVFDDVMVVVRVVSGIKQIITLASGSLFYVVPSRKADISLGIATKALPDPQPTPFSVEAAGIVTNLTPQLLPAKKSGAGVTASAFKKVKGGTLQVTPVRPGAYDSLKHPGDVSWVSGDKKTVLSWWGGAKYCTGASLFAGLTDAPVVTTAMLDADATSEISDVIDGTVPCAYSTGSGIPAVNNYAWGRSIPAQLEHTLWKNGSLWKKNWPGIAHGLYDKGLNLCTLWGDTVIEEDCWMVRPYVRIYHAADPAVQGDTTRTETSYLHVTGGYGVRLPSGAFREGLFLVMDPDLITYHFYGKFDPTERKLHLYGVHMAPGSTVPTNGVYSFTIDVSSAAVTGDITVPGSNRVATSVVTPYTLSPDPASSDEIVWGAPFVDPQFSLWRWDGYSNWDWHMCVAYSELGTGEAVNRVLNSETSTTTTRNRFDDELLSMMESPTSFGRAVAPSVGITSLNIRNYQEVGTERKVRVVRDLYYGYCDQVNITKYINAIGSTDPASPPSKTLNPGFTSYTGVNIQTTYVTEDLNHADHGDTVTFNAPMLEWYGTYSGQEAISRAFALVGYTGPQLPGGPTGTYGSAGRWDWIDGVSISRIRTLSGKLLCQAVDTLVTSTWGMQGTPGAANHFGLVVYGADSGPVNYGLYTRSVNTTRFKYEQHEHAYVDDTRLSFGTLPPAYMTSFYDGVASSIWWFEADNSTVIEDRSVNHTVINVVPVPVILAYGDLRWPIAQQLTVAPWECTDSHGRKYKPGYIAVDSSSDIAGNVTLSRTFQEIVFTPGTSQLGPFRDDALTTIPSPYSIYDTYTSRTAEFLNHEDYLVGFWEATEINYGVSRYPGVPHASDVTGPLPAPSLDGLEYFWHYDIDPDHTLLFGLPYGDMLAADTRPCTWVARSVGSSVSAPVRIGINGLWDDNVVYNSPIFVKKIK